MNALQDLERTKSKNFNDFVFGCGSSTDRDGASCHPKDFRQEFADRIVRFSIYRWGGDPNLEFSVANDLDAVTTASGLNSDSENCPARLGLHPLPR